MAPHRFSGMDSPLLMTLDSLMEYLAEHKRQYPDHGKYKVELRHFVLVCPPATLPHDDRDKVVILSGIPGM